MHLDHDFIEHVKIVNDMIQVIIHKGRVMGDWDKYNALRISLPDHLKEKIEGFWLKKPNEHGAQRNVLVDMLNKKTDKYETLVYLFLEEYTWKNLNKSSTLVSSPNLKTTRAPVPSFHWLKDMVPTIMDREKVEVSIPRKIIYK